MRQYREFLYEGTGWHACTVIGHRGACAYFPENTMVSFRGALDLGADMVELDIQCTRDGEIVVMHDEKVNRCTNGRGRVKDLGYAQMRALDAGSWFGKRFAGEKVPALAEVLEYCRGKIAVNIEIKSEAVGDSAIGGIEEKTLELVSRMGMREHVIYSSFSPMALAHLREVDQSAPIAVLYEKKHYKKMSPARIMEHTGADCFNCSRDEFRGSWARELVSCNIPVNVYTVNDRGALARLAGAGVGGIFTNKPDVMRAVLAASGKM